MTRAGMADAGHILRRRHGPGPLLARPHRIPGSGCRRHGRPATFRAKPLGDPAVDGLSLNGRANAPKARAGRHGQGDRHPACHATRVQDRPPYASSVLGRGRFAGSHAGPGTKPGEPECGWPGCARGARLRAGPPEKLSRPLERCGPCSSMSCSTVLPPRWGDPPSGQEVAWPPRFVIFSKRGALSSPA